MFDNCKIPIQNSDHKFNHWNDSKGMDFVGMEGNGGGASSSARNSFTKTAGNSINPMLDNTTFRIDHKEYDPSQHDLANELSELALSKFELTPAEFANLKRIHGGDPFPMTSTVAVSVFPSIFRF